MTKATYYDYDNQAWVENGRYVPCGHRPGMDCSCYGKLHAGEPAPPPPPPDPCLADLPPEEIYRVATRERYGFLCDAEAKALNRGKWGNTVVLVRGGANRRKCFLKHLNVILWHFKTDGDYVRDVSILLGPDGEDPYPERG